MKDLYLVNYSVKGIKTIDQPVNLSFYKKIITKNIDTREYNVKGIYGMNGSGKSGIVTSVDILKNILMNPGYLNNPLVQSNLEAIVNKKLGKLNIGCDYLARFGEMLLLLKYDVTLAKDKSGKFVISKEKLLSKKATSKSETMDNIFEVENGKIISIIKTENEDFERMIWEETTNLLSSSSMCVLFYEKILISDLKINDLKRNILFESLISLVAFGKEIYVYMDQSDEHTDYLIENSLGYYENSEYKKSNIDSLIKHMVDMEGERLKTISVSNNFISKKLYNRFKVMVNDLYEFLRIFKSDLRNIEIDKKENGNTYICNLVMVYDSHRIHAEYESTGIKKLIRLYAYLRKMVRGGIVFIDEFDSNLHDVYLCALLEYLMEYGKGQLCFTTHNVGPMDVLRQHKKSIDFLSVDHKIYPWTTNGNYSPSKLYRNGMIEGSPFNVDSIDFIGVFGLGEEDE